MCRGERPGAGWRGAAGRGAPSPEGAASASPAAPLQVGPWAPTAPTPIVAPFQLRRWPHRAAHLSQGRPRGQRCLSWGRCGWAGSCHQTRGTLSRRKWLSETETGSSRTSSLTRTVQGPAVGWVPSSGQVGGWPIRTDCGLQVALAGAGLASGSSTGPSPSTRLSRGFVSASPQVLSGPTEAEALGWGWAPTLKPPQGCSELGVRGRPDWQEGGHHPAARPWLWRVLPGLLSPPAPAWLWGPSRLDVAPPGGFPAHGLVIPTPNGPLSGPCPSSALR